MTGRQITGHGIAAAGLALITTMAVAQDGGSRMARSFSPPNGGTGNLQQTSMFYIAPPDTRTFKKHDLVQILVRETSRAKSIHELETSKDYDISGKISAWPDMSLEDLFNLQMFAGRMTQLPKLDVTVGKEFVGEGDYKRQDEFTTRISAKVLEILPNGNLILEARTYIKTDEEESTIKITGVCRTEDVTAANSILSSQIHDLKIEKIHEGELKKSNEKGLLAKILDALLAF